MLKVVVTAVLISQRLSEFVGLLLDTVQRSDRDGVERSSVSLCIGGHATGLAEAIVKVGFGFARRDPRVIGLMAFAFFDLEILRRHDREPKRDLVQIEQLQRVVPLSKSILASKATAPQ